MIRLFQNDFRRMLSRKSYLSIFASIPFMVYFMGMQCLKANKILSIDRQTSFNTFVLYTPMHKVFSIYLFSIVVIMVVITLASEYENGEIRMVLIRGYHSWQVLIVKYLNVLISLGLFLSAYVGISYTVGLLLFPRELTISTFLSSTTINSTEAFVLTLKYYLIVFLILSVFATIICFICVLFPSVVTATAISMVVILVSFGFYLVTQLLAPYIESSWIVDEMNLLSLLLMQLKGLYSFIGGDIHLLKVGLSILMMYFLGFGASSFIVSYKKDQLI